MKLPAEFKPAAWGLAWAATISLAYHLGDHAQEPPVQRDAVPLAADRTAASSHSAQMPLQGKSDLTAAANAPTSETAKLPPKLDFAAELTIRMAMPPGPERNRALHALFADWSHHDGPAALAATAEITEPLLRYELRETSLNHWARQNPEAAWQHLKANPGADLPDNPTNIIIQGLGKADVATALAFFKNHNGADLGPHLDAAIGAFDQLYQRGGKDQLIAWTQTLPAGGMKDGAINRIIDQWARYDPAAAEKWMNSQINTNPKNTVAARVELTESWARVNPMEALNYVGRLPANQQDPAYYECIFRRWLDYDKKAAAAFLAEQPPNPILDRQFERYAYDVMNQNPSDTMPWAESITDPTRRWKAISRVANAWRKKDPQALSKYVSTADFLSAEQKDQLLQVKK